MWGSTRFSFGSPNFLLYISMIYVKFQINYSFFYLHTNLFCSGDNLKTVSGITENEMVKLESWFDGNKLI